MIDGKQGCVEVEGVTFTYAGSAHAALDDVSLSIGSGDFVGIIGPSGAGKSTLLSALNGIIPHRVAGDFYGSVRIGGADTHETSLAGISRMVATMFQDVDAQMVATVVEDEVMFGLENFGVAHEEIPARVDEALALTGALDMRRRAIGTLSGGQKQKVALAAVLALRPQVLVLDEPTGALDPASSRRVFSLLAELNERQGITVVVVEQKIGLLAEYARTLAVLDRGKLAYQGPRRAVLAEADELLRIGVNVPRVTTLSCLLRDEGFGVGRMACDVDEAHALIKEMTA